jgi:hypothetical protein
MFSSRRMKWTEQIARMGEVRIRYRDFVGKLERKRKQKDLVVDDSIIFHVCRSV